LTKIILKELEIELHRKDIRNLHLSVYPSLGRVRVFAPENMNEDVIRAYLVSKIPWIRKQIKNIFAQEREGPREFLERESHYFEGKRYLLEIVETVGVQGVAIRHNRMQLHAKKDASTDTLRALVERFYRMHLKEEVQRLVGKYEPVLGVVVAEFGIKKMKTRWGTCNHEARRIWVNLELAKKPQKCLEYIVVHGMVHILEPSHNKRFIALMDRFYPTWRAVKEELNRMPVKHEEWKY